MGTVTEKLQAVLNSKNAIKTKFGLADDLPFSQYAENINVGSTTSGETDFYICAETGTRDSTKVDLNILVVAGFPEVNLLSGDIDINGEYTLVDPNATGYARKWLNAEKGLYIADSMGGGTWYIEEEGKSVAGRLYPVVLDGGTDPYNVHHSSYPWQLMGTVVSGGVMPKTSQVTRNYWTGYKLYKKQNSKYYIAWDCKDFFYEEREPTLYNYYNKDITIRADYVYGPEPAFFFGGFPLELENPLAIGTDRIWYYDFYFLEDAYIYKIVWSTANQRWEFLINDTVKAYSSDPFSKSAEWFFSDGVEGYAIHTVPRYFKYYDKDRTGSVNGETVGPIGRSINITELITNPGTVIPLTVNIDDMDHFGYEVKVADDSVVEFEEISKTDTGVTLNITSFATTFKPEDNASGSYTGAIIYLYERAPFSSSIGLNTCVGIISLDVSYDALRDNINGGETAFTGNLVLEGWENPLWVMGGSTVMYDINGVWTKGRYDSSSGFVEDSTVTGQSAAYQSSNKLGIISYYSSRWHLDPTGYVEMYAGINTTTTGDENPYNADGSSLTWRSGESFTIGTVKAEQSGGGSASLTGNIIVTGGNDPGVWTLGRLSGSSFTADSTVTGTDRAWRSPNYYSYILHGSKIIDEINTKWAMQDSMSVDLGVPNTQSVSAAGLENPWDGAWDKGYTVEAETAE